MSNVKNEPKYKNALLAAIREQLEHRAFWLRFTPVVISSLRMLS